MKAEKMVLMRGPCDVTAIAFYLKKTKNLIVENCPKGKYLDVVWDLSNSIYLMQAAKKEKIISPFVEPLFYPNDDVFSGKYSYIVLSTISDGILGVYENIRTQEIIAYGNCTCDATYNCGEKYFDKNVVHGGIPLITKEQYAEFAKDYVFRGRIKVGECVDNFLTFCQAVPKTTSIIILLGATQPNVFGEKNPAMSLEGIKFYGDLKMKLREKLKKFDNVSFIDPDVFYKSPKRKTDIFFYGYPTINHYPCLTYYKMACFLETLTNGNVSVNKLKYISKCFYRFLKSLLKI